jgi:hypothetical protein
MKEEKTVFNLQPLAGAPQQVLLLIFFEPLEILENFGLQGFGCCSRPVYERIWEPTISGP